jgi:hypothetical protein
MLNLFTLARQFFNSHPWPQDVDDCSDDPLSHPALQRMTLEQLADLPFDRGPASMESCSTHSVKRGTSSRK